LYHSETDFDARGELAVEFERASAGSRTAIGRRRLTCGTGSNRSSSRTSTSREGRSASRRRAVSPEGLRSGRSLGGAAAPVALERQRSSPAAAPRPASARRLSSTLACSTRQMCPARHRCCGCPSLHPAGAMPQESRDRFKEPPREANPSRLAECQADSLRIEREDKGLRLVQRAERLAANEPRPDCFLNWPHSLPTLHERKCHTNG